MENDSPRLSIEFLADSKEEPDHSPRQPGTVFGTTEELPAKELAERVRQHAAKCTEATRSSHG